MTNGSVTESSIGIDLLPNGSIAFPWGMQWMYPCAFYDPILSETQCF